MLGNHDIHYLLFNTSYFDNMRGSGFNDKLLLPVNSLYRENEDLFQVAWQRGNILATHAGLCQHHYDYDLKEFHKNFPDLNIAAFLNMLWEKRSGLLMKIGKRRYGNDRQGSIFWADKFELLEDPLQNYFQIVGHTPQQKIVDTDEDFDIFSYKRNWNKKTRLVFMDCLIYRSDKEENPSFFELEVKE